MLLLGFAHFITLPFLLLLLLFEQRRCLGRARAGALYLKNTRERASFWMRKKRERSCLGFLHSIIVTLNVGEKLPSKATESRRITNKIRTNTHERSTQILHPSPTLGRIERRNRPDRGKRETVGAVGRGWCFYRVLDDWCVFVYVSFRDLSLSLSLSLSACVVRKHLTDLVSFLKNFRSSTREQQAISLSRGRRVL